MYLSRNLLSTCTVLPARGHVLFGVCCWTNVSILSSSSVRESLDDRQASVKPLCVCVHVMRERECVHTVHQRVLKSANDFQLPFHDVPYTRGPWHPVQSLDDGLSDLDPVYNRSPEKGEKIMYVVHQQLAEKTAGGQVQYMDYTLATIFISPSVITQAISMM